MEQEQGALSSFRLVIDRLRNRKKSKNQDEKQLRSTPGLDLLPDRTPGNAWVKPCQVGPLQLGSQTRTIESQSSSISCTSNRLRAAAPQTLTEDGNLSAFQPFDGEFSASSTSKLEQEAFESFNPLGTNCTTTTIAADISAAEFASSAAWGYSQESEAAFQEQRFLEHPEYAHHMNPRFSSNYRSRFAPFGFHDPFAPMPHPHFAFPYHHPYAPTMPQQQLVSRRREI